MKNWLTGKDPDAGKDWRREKKGMIQDEMVGWHHWLNGHEFEQALGGGEGQGSLVCCSPWGHKESDPTEWLNNDKTLMIQSSTREVITQSYVKGAEKFCNRFHPVSAKHRGSWGFLLPSLAICGQHALFSSQVPAGLTGCTSGDGCRGWGLGGAAHLFPPWVPFGVHCGVEGRAALIVWWLQILCLPIQ